MSQKLGRAFFAGALVVALAGCAVKAPRLPGDAARMIGMGDSIGEGVQSADASLRTQPFSYLKFLARQIRVPFSLPLIKSGPLGEVGDTSNRSRLIPSLAASNLAVAGSDVESLLNDRADAITEDDIDSERDLVLFPRRASQIEIAESVAAPFIVCWIGGGNVLPAVASFDELDASQLTPVQEFSADFAQIVQRLNALDSPVIFANILDVTQIGFLVDRQDLVKFLGSDFGLAEGDLTSVVVMLLIRLGLDDGSLLNDPNFVLDANEVTLIQQRIEVFNRIIEDAVTPLGIPVVDVKAMFDAIAADPPVFRGVTLTPRFLGGLSSLDGVHPSNIGHALLANAFIETINAHFETHIPPISKKGLEFIFLTDPFVDKDGDGRVPGRFGAGLLETLGPLLGISGDFDDFIADPPQAAIDESLGIQSIEEGLGMQFIQRYLILQGKDPQEASKWDKKDVMEALRHILGLKIFEKAPTSRTGGRSLGRPR